MPAVRHEPAKLSIRIEPQSPITVAELYELTPGVNLDRRVGLTVMVNESVHY